MAEAPYQKTLSTSLMNAGMLNRLLRVTSDLNLEVLATGGDSLKLIKRFPYFRPGARLLSAIWRRLPKEFQLRPAVPALASSRLADWLLQKYVGRSTVFHGPTGICHRSMRAAKQLGAITLVEHAARHPRHWRQVIEKESLQFGVDHRLIDHGFTDRRIRHMEHMFEECDRIIVPSSLARQSFVEMGYANKIAVVHTGVDHQTFFPGQMRDAPVFRVCYVGRLELAKGLGYLLQAWKRLRLSGAELVLAGEIKSEMKGLLATEADSTVIMTGELPQSKVAECYRASNVFVLPSANEGLSQSLLEAMASGLCVVATDLSSATECVTNRREGIIVPARDVDSLADAILWCYRHRDESQGMGKAARARIEEEFTLDHYNQRIIAFYCGLKRLQGAAVGQDGACM